MSAAQDGGPVFPVTSTRLEMAHDDIHNEDHPIGNVHSVGGMSLRDWFAGQALAGLMSRDDPRHFAGPTEDKEGLRKWRESVFGEDANICYAQADAMLAARKTGGTSND